MRDANTMYKSSLSTFWLLVAGPLCDSLWLGSGREILVEILVGGSSLFALLVFLISLATRVG